jgi:hypothetical protein
MGFLKSITGILGGGTESSGSSSSGGFNALSPQIQGAYNDLASALQKQIPAATANFTPMPQTADETNAFNAIRRGFTPTAQSLQSDVGLLTNPFNDQVIGDVNRAANSDFSILKQNLGQVGQFGSNRQMLGANDIEQTRLGTIGKLRQDQYNKTLDQIFNSLIPQRAQDAAGLLGIGQFQRGLDTQTRTAGVTALQEVAKALGILPTQEGSSQSNQSSSSSKGLLSLF